MKRKGFTLIEMIAVIVLIALLSVFITPSVLSSLNAGKNVSYNTLLRNVVTSAQTYYEECEYGDLSSTLKYGIYACSINSDTITTTLGALANTGFLKVNDIKEEDGREVKIVLNPKTDADISSCQINIKKIKEETTDVNGIKNIKVTYSVIGIGENCPTTSEYEGAV